MGSGGFRKRTGADLPLVYDNVSSGHRANYVRLFAALVGGEGKIGPYWRNLVRLVLCPSLMIPSFEGSPRRNLAIIMARILLRRRTAVLFLRAHLIEHRRGIPRFVHRAALRIMGTDERVLPISIVGNENLQRMCPRIQVIADPEFWDYEFAPPAVSDQRLMREVRARAGNRKILLVAGSITADKAVGELGKIFACSPALSDAFFPVLAGSVHPNAVAGCAFVSEHGLKLDGPIDDSTFRSLFEAADFAWCAYGPRRDMSSGILGRCIQSSVIPIVRRMSVAEGLARTWTDVIAVDFSDPQASAKELLSLSHQPSPVDHSELRAEGHRVQQMLREFLYQGLR